MNIEKELAKMALKLYIQGYYNIRQVAHTIGKAVLVFRMKQGKN